jgi:hypothetical protein
MPNLIQSFHGRDIGYLRIVARLWGIELVAADTDGALDELSAALKDPATVTEIVESLPPEARSALAALAEAGGKIPWSVFMRTYGEIRQAGPGRRDRDQIHLHPVSPAEALFYRALLAKAFFDTPGGPQEFAYIPEDLIPMIHHKEEINPNLSSGVINQGDPILGRPAVAKERKQFLPASDRILDDTTTLLAALRMNIEPPEMLIPSRVVLEFLTSAKIILEGSPQIEPVRLFLEAPRKEALKLLIDAWRESDTFNELHQVPGLVCEGGWQNAPRSTRDTLLGFLGQVPKNQWWSLPAFIRDIKEKHPDYQRPAGDYDSWFIKRADADSFLRGFASWDEVDGALIRYLVTGPLFWLGMVDLAAPGSGEPVAAFRINVNRTASSEDGRSSVLSNGRITVPRQAPRVARYLLSRFCEWDLEKPDEYRYRVSTGSLKKAGTQGLKVSQLLGLLAKNASAELPPAFVKALKRWEMNGTEARVELQTILKVRRPEVLEELRRSKAGRFIAETLGPVTVVVKSGSSSKVLAALAELGLLAEDATSNERGEK